jgi:hypothetical protein
MLNKKNKKGVLMLRFHIIESGKWTFKNQPIGLITKNMNCFQGLKILSEDQEDTIFIIAEGREGLMGGACLVKRRFKDIQEDVRELVMTLPPQNYVWECSAVYLEMPYELETSELQYFFQSFYRGLYEECVEFGKMKGVGFLIMKLPSEVYDSTKEFGLWPYVVELKPDHSLDRFFHGILPLTGSQHEAYCKLWKNVTDV